MNVVAAKTEPAPLTCANPSATASSCDQGHVKLRSASAVMQRCCQPCDLATSYCEGVTVVAAPYSQNSTGTPTGTPRTDHNNCSCQYPLDKATSTHIVERSPLQYCQCKCLESSQTAQAEYPVLRNNDDQSRDSNRCLRSALEQRSTQTLLCGPHQKMDVRRHVRAPSGHQVRQHAWKIFTASRPAMRWLPCACRSNLTCSMRTRCFWGVSPCLGEINGAVVVRSPPGCDLVPTMKTSDALLGLPCHQK